MSTQVYQLAYDYEQQNGHFLVLQGGGTGSLSSDDLAQIQVNMLKSNEIEKVLPVEIEEINFNVRMFYRITNKRMLTNVLREQPIQMRDLYTILYRISTGIESSSKYMLEEQHFIIRDEFIFVGASLDDIYMTYLPLKEVSGKPTLQSEFKDLLIRLVGHVKELAGDGVQQLMNELDKDAFHLPTFTALLKELRQQKTSTKPKQSRPVQTPVHRQESSVVTPTVKARQSVIQQEPVGGKVQQSKGANPRPNKPKSNNKKQVATINTKQTNKNGNEAKQEGKKEKPNLLIFIVLTGFAVIVAWKLYEMNPSSMMLLVCIGLNIATVVGALLFYLYKKNGSLRVKKSMQQAETSKQPRQSKTKKQKPVVNHVQEEVFSQTQTPPVAERQNPVAEEQHYFENLQNETTVLSADPGTVLLNEEISLQKGPYLEVNRNHGPEQITLNKDVFTIGRNPNGSDYVEDTVGISRLHFELKTADNECYLKDLGSKNGTELNGEKIIPYKVYTLQEGAKIKAGKVIYTFKYA